MLTSKAIIDHVTQPPSRFQAGKVAFDQKRLTDRMGNLVAPVSHRRFLDEVAAQCADTNPTPASYQHPADDPKARPAGKPSDGLTPSDLAWINRLPADPAAVPFDDAVALAGLASGLSTFKNPSDVRLVQSVWAPVRELHDANAARVALAAAQTPVPNVPSSALSALTDSIAAEVPNLQPAEAVGRAGNLLREALDKRATVRQQKVDDARAAIARAQEAAAARTATTR